MKKRRKKNRQGPVSSEGAKDNNQRRKPLECWDEETTSPNGAIPATPVASVAPLGLTLFLLRSFPGVCTPGYYLSPLWGYYFDLVDAAPSSQADLSS